MQFLFVSSAIYTIAVYICTEKTVFIAVVVSDLLEKFPFSVDTGWRCGVTYHVLLL
jgi:hypothetical protein